MLTSSLLPTVGFQQVSSHLLKMVSMKLQSDLERLQMSLLKVSVWFTVITPLFLCYETILITVHMSHFTP